MTESPYFKTIDENGSEEPITNRDIEVDYIGESKGAEVEVVYAKEHDIPVIKVLGPATAFFHLEKQFGKPEKRKEIF